LADHPEFSSKINLFVGLAPLTFIRHVDVSLLKFLNDPELFKLVKILGIHQFLPYPDTPTLFYYLCDYLSFICTSIVGFLTNL